MMGYSCNITFHGKCFLKAFDFADFILEEECVKEYDILQNMDFMFNLVNFKISFLNKINILCSDAGSGKSFVINALTDLLITNKISFTHADYKHQSVDLNGNILLLDNADILYDGGAV